MGTVMGWLQSSWSTERNREHKGVPGPQVGGLTSGITPVFLLWFQSEWPPPKWRLRADEAPMRGDKTWEGTCFERIHNTGTLPGAPRWALELPRQPWDEMPSLSFVWIWHQHRDQGTTYSCSLTSNHSPTLVFPYMSRLSPSSSSPMALPGASPFPTAELNFSAIDCWSQTWMPISFHCSNISTPLSSLPLVRHSTPLTPSCPQLHHIPLLSLLSDL